MRVLALLVLLGVVSAFAGTAMAQSTPFTYQGRLHEFGVPANGVYDLRFRLYDAAAGLTQVGSTQCIDNVAVVDGTFTATLDFGAQFTGTAARFLEIDVREGTSFTCANLAGFTTLTPRQEVTHAPRASAANVANALVRSNGTGGGVVNVTDAGSVGVNTITPVAKLHVAGGDVVAGAAGQEWIFHTRSASGGDFLQLTDADAGAFQFQRGLVVHQNGNVGVGTTAPASKLDVRGDVRLGNSGQFFAVKSPSNDRTLRGAIAGNGTIDTTRSTSGFTVTNSTVGTYVINFNPAFTSPPVIVAMPNAACCKVHVSQTQTTFATIFVRDAADNTTATAAPFHFIVMGQ
ncbi:MAG TPA: hypothetical protein VK157_01260 [Phycisphaerales bacterium]|nr:hypothetical protein [Phycisphaerales bacterium]